MDNNPYTFSQLLQQQANVYTTAYCELKAGKKVGNWGLFIFPRMRALATSRKGYIFGIANAAQARAYLAHPVLRPRLIACCQALLRHTDKSAVDILGEADAERLRASMTLFALISTKGSVFHEVLDRFFDGQTDFATRGLIRGRVFDLTPLAFHVGSDPREWLLAGRHYYCGDVKTDGKRVKHPV